MGVNPVILAELYLHALPACPKGKSFKLETELEFFSLFKKPEWIKYKGRCHRIHTFAAPASPAQAHFLSSYKTSATKANLY